MEDIGNGFTAYTLEDLGILVTEAERLRSGVGFEHYLRDEGYKKKSEFVYIHSEPEQIIELTQNKNQITYANNLDRNDKGNFINFLQNRHLEVGRIIPNEKIHTFLSAVQVALQYEQKAHSIKISPVKPPMKIKRKSKGL
ncbi:hypothetical protein [Pedobacter steynii]|uniref:Uncharacterized protein n=1 Tax=Pedobacter steynii TaxID=430522 RepID=A0A1D7QMY8_9SPHI|nr:hypothetical protein [Pedobacter steynii]AOM80030.1 hypothetical protein BFS30_24430 [Pedobacter steynii]